VAREPRKKATGLGPLGVVFQCPFALFAADTSIEISEKLLANLVEKISSTESGRWPGFWMAGDLTSFEEEERLTQGLKALTIFLGVYGLAKAMPLLQGSRVNHVARSI
jgi:hypothetical protein